MRSSFLIATALALLAAPATAQGTTCPIAGIATQDLGAGCGFGLPATLALGWNASTCSLDVDVTAFACCNTFVTSHWLGAGVALTGPLALNEPWLPGCDLLILPLALAGPFQGTTSSLAIPPNPVLVGLTIDFQAYPVYFTTIGLTTDLGATQAVRVTFN